MTHTQRLNEIAGKEPKKGIGYYLGWLFTQVVFAVMFVASKCRRKS